MTKRKAKKNCWNSCDVLSPSQQAGSYIVKYRNPICEHIHTRKSTSHIYCPPHITYIALRFLSSCFSTAVKTTLRCFTSTRTVKVITWLRQMLAPFDPYWNERLLTESQRLSISINVHHHQWCTKEFIGSNHYSIYIIILLVLFYIVSTLLCTNIYFKKCSYNLVYYHTRKWDIRKDIKCRQKKQFNINLMILRK